MIIYLSYFNLILKNKIYVECIMDIIHHYNNIAPLIIRMSELMNRMNITNLNEYEVRQLIMTDNYQNIYPTDSVELLYILNEITNHHIPQ
jgi:hypothetical protein